MTFWFTLWWIWTWVEWVSFTLVEDSWEKLLVAEEAKNIKRVGEQNQKTQVQESIYSKGLSDTYLMNFYNYNR